MLCNNCRQETPNGQKFCVHCGGVLKEQKEVCDSCHHDWISETNYCVFCGHKKGTPVGLKTFENPQIQIKTHQSKKKSLWPLFAAVVIVMGSIGAYLIWDNGEVPTRLAEKETEGQAFEPLETPISGTKAFDIEPLDGVRVSAPENALDKERLISMSKMDEAYTQEIGQRLVNQNKLLIEVFRFDAGMDKSERLPGEMTIAFDLDKIALDPVLLPYLQVLHIDEDGYMEEVNSVVEDNQLICQTDQNYAFAIALGFAIGIPVAAYINGDEIKEMNLSNSSHYANTKFLHTKMADGYYIQWPERMLSKNPQEVAKQMQLLNDALNKYGIDSLETFYSNIETYSREYAAVVAKVLNDPVVQKQLALISSRKWLIENMYPDSVGFTIQALEEADKYLFGVRKFKKPLFTVKVWLLDVWLEGNELAISNNPSFATPYIHVNGSYDIKKELSDFYITIAHELFHVAQVRYTTYDWKKDIWFWEGTARVLEREVQAYYLEKKVIDQSIALTFRDNYKYWRYSFGLIKYWPDLDMGNVLKPYGYSTSYFLEYMQEQYYQNKSLTFLPDLLSNYAYYMNTMIDDIHDTLKSMTTGDLGLYNHDFVEFAVSMSDTIYNIAVNELEIQRLSVAKPVLELDLPSMPYAIDMKYIALDYEPSKYGADDFKVVMISPETPQGNSQIHYYRRGQENRYILNQRIVDFEGTGPGNHGLLQLISLNDLDKSYRAPLKLVLMAKPELAVLEIDDKKEEMTIQLTDPNLDGHELIYYNLVLIKDKNGNITTKKILNNRFTMDFKTLDQPMDLKNTSIELDIDVEVLSRAAEVLNGITNQKSYAVSYCQVLTAYGDEIVGPMSDVAEIELDIENDGQVDVMGSWKGKVQITGERVSINISEGIEGYDYTMTISMYEDMAFYGNNNGDGTITFGEDQGFMFLLIINSKDELYMTAPPITLTR